MVWGALAGAAAPLVGAAVGYDQGSEDRRRERVAQERALAEMQGLELPEYDFNMPNAPEYQQLSTPDLQSADYSNVAQYNPEMMEAVHMGPSAMEGISTDPTLRQAQMNALEQLQQVGADGMTAEDKFRMAQMQQANSRAERGSRDAIAQNMQERGISGSGMELAAQLANQQSSAEQSRMEALGIEGMAQARALEAMAQSGQLSGQMRGQDFGEQSSIAQAQDAISRFNAGQSAATQAANTAARNSGQMINRDLQIDQAREAASLANQQQDITRQNQMYGNQMAAQSYGDKMGQTQYGNQLKSQQYGDQYQKASGLSGAYGQSAVGHAERSRQKAALGAGVGSGIGQGTAAYNQYGKK